MSLAGLEFAFFFPLVFLLHWLGPRRAAWQNAVLLLASVAFYATWNLSLLGVLAGATAVSFAAGVGLGAMRTEGRPEARATAVRRGRRALLIAAIAAELGVLGVFKYSGFFADSL